LALACGCFSDDGEPSGGLGPCIDGTVTIGNQTWQRCNLNVVPNSGNSSCYNNQESNCAIYGRLYDWATAMDLPDYCNSNSCEEIISYQHRGICPKGWHIPSEENWDELMKAQNDDFSALLGGYGDSDGSFSYAGNYGYWWSADEMFSNNFNKGAYGVGMYYSSEYVNWGSFDKSFLISVRCVQDK